jgi:fatty-acyl-CoA synthase
LKIIQYVLEKVLEIKPLNSTIADLNSSLPQELDSKSSDIQTMAIKPTPTKNSQIQRLADFDTLTEALDFAASGTTGYNFYDAKGNLHSVLSYSVLRERARVSAKRLLGLGLTSGERVAIVADTTPEFVELFFACRYVNG